MIIISIIEKLLIIYFVLYILIDIFFYFYALGYFTLISPKKNNEHGFTDFESDKINIVVPAYNEEVSITVCAEMLMNINYPNYNVIIVNDGSKDDTLNQLLNFFNFRSLPVNKYKDSVIKTAPIKNIYEAHNGKLILIDKQNGGKSDAINAAINIADGTYLCTIDADSILDSAALTNVVAPLARDKSVFVSGGQVALSNGLLIKKNKIEHARMPRHLLVLFQILEYISTFMVARLCLSRIHSLLIMSGAFSVYRKNDLLQVGGFLSALNNHPYILKKLGYGKQTITEDMEIILRLRQYYYDRKIKARVVFEPRPVCWTEAPENISALFKQRMRWHQGLAQTLWLYRNMLFEPKYGVTGLFAMPYYFFMELLSPLVKLFALLFISLMIFAGAINQQWVYYLIAATVMLYAIILSSATVIIERWSHKQTETNRKALRYKNIFDWLLLIFIGVISSFTFAFLRMFAQLKGFYNFLRKKNDWHKFERKGLQVK